MKTTGVISESIPQATDESKAIQPVKNTKTLMKRYQRIRVMGEILRTRIKSLKINYPI